jgi:hypothetical protein
MIWRTKTKARKGGGKYVHLLFKNEEDEEPFAVVWSIDFMGRKWAARWYGYQATFRELEEAKAWAEERLRTGDAMFYRAPHEYEALKREEES